MWWLFGFLAIGYVILHLLVRSRSLVSPFIIGHRGAAGLAPENTLAAIYTGLKEGASVIEVDIHMTIDNVLVVHHDQTVNRTTNGTGRIDTYHWEELRKLDAGGHFSRRFEGELIPSLADVLDVMGQTGVTLAIEVKHPRSYPGIDENLAGLLKEYPGNVIIISFDLGWLKRFSDAYPGLAVAQVMETARPRFDIPATQAVSINWRALFHEPFFVRRMHERGWQVWVWTVDKRWLMRLMLWVGVDGITTNRPDICRLI
ncbi:MAG: glycerophosphodiester phosphodiesterase [Chloroflexi bacterium]|nr:glycerophosphodiester phosphodiesterase [Chloroflexota bacterium]